MTEWPRSTVHRSEFRPLGHHLHTTPALKTRCRKCEMEWPNKYELKPENECKGDKA